MPSSSHPVTPAAGFSLYQFFAPGGILSKTHPAYEFRRGQLQMAQAVEEALEEKRHLIVEAGTGTGKTLAYLLPVIRSGKRVIFLTLDDGYGCNDVTFFEDIQQGSGSLLFTSSLFLVRGEIRRTGPRGISLRAVQAWELTDSYQKWRNLPVYEPEHG